MTVIITSMWPLPSITQNKVASLGIWEEAILMPKHFFLRKAHGLSDLRCSQCKRLALTKLQNARQQGPAGTQQRKIIGSRGAATFS